MSQRRAIVAMSGGVDSSVAAAMALDDGWEVIGVTMRLWGGESDTGCCAISDTEDARRVAQRLGIDFYVFNFSDALEEHVVNPYVDAHARGATPNPCIECNRHLKFDLLLNRALELGCDTVITGHHARRVEHTDGTVRIARAVDAAKDQSYVLHTLSRDQLGMVRFPIGEMTKDEVRRRAADLGLRTADKPDSQDVCFVTRAAGRRAFLGDRIPLHPAPVVDVDGNEVGRTDAVETVTIGQRRGLDLSGGSSPRYVVSVDVPGRRAVVGGHDDLLVDRTAIAPVSWTDSPHPGPFLVQTSAHGRAVGATLETVDGGAATVVWDEPHRRVAPGQSVVLYVGDEVVGGALATPK